MQVLPVLLENALDRATAEPAWLAERRRAAAAAVTARGLPTVAEEAWKYTSLAAIEAPPYRLAAGADGALLSANGVAALDPASPATSAIVFVNGCLRADLGAFNRLPDGLRARGLASVLAEEPEILGDALAVEPGAAFSAFNTATLSDGLLLEVADGVRIDEPLTLLFAGAATSPLLRTPRIVIRVGRNASLRVVEEYLSVPGDCGLTNVVTNIDIGAGGVLFHHRLQRETDTSTHIGRVSARVGANATLHSDSVVFGGDLTRIDIDVALHARGARCQLNGLFAGRGSQHIDHHTTIDHQVGDTHSEELYRGILDDRARGVFNGKVIVRRDAQQISARQASNNLLLSRQAEIDTKPELEIYADDVTCAHGATVGELDREALFYLRSRGIGETQARALLTFAFAEKVIAAIPLASLRRTIELRFIGHHDMSEMLDGIQS